LLKLPESKCRNYEKEEAYIFEITKPLIQQFC
jgi:hypothetical protein